MLKNYKKMSLAAAACMLLGISASQAAVVLTVESRTGGGVKVTASGSLDTSVMTWAQDVTSSGTPSTFSFSSGFALAAYQVGAYEEYTLPDGTYIPSSYTWTNFSPGSLSRGLRFGATQLRIYGAGAADNNVAPVTTSFAFNFTMEDPAGTLSQYTSGVIWDSNGAAAGGETVSFAVVPEPSGLILFALGAMGFVTRRQRRPAV